MKAKTIKAIDAIIAGLEELKEALASEASKSGGDADDEGAGKVSGRGGKAAAGKVPAAGKKSRPAPDDDGDVDGDDDAGDDDGEVEPPKKAGVKAGAKPAAKGKASAKDEDEPDLDAVKAKLTAVMNEEELGKPKVVAVLKKFNATKSAELDESDYAAVIKACDKLLASVAPADEDDV